MLSYNYTGDEIITVQLLVYKVEYNDKIIKSPESIFTLKTLGLNKYLADITIDKTKLGYNKLLPLTMDKNDYKNKLVETKAIISNGSVESVSINGNSIDLVNLINENNKEKCTIDVNTKIYTDIDNNFVVTLDTNHIDSNLNHNINIYTINGQKALNVIDKKIDNSSFTRKIGNVTNVINNKKLVTNTSIDIKLDVIKKPKPKFNLINFHTNDPFIGTIDLETFEYNSISKVYAAGYYTKQFNCKTFYIDVNDLNSDSVVINMIYSLVIFKYTGYTFYVHNFGRFDSVFILNILIKENLKREHDKFEINTLFRGNLILSLSISKKVKTKTYTIKIVDSFNILPHSLSKLCKTYNTEVSKDIFPYSFININTLFYNGVRPNIEYYNNPTEDIDKSLYNMIDLNNWSTKNETIKYLEKDLISLHQVINKFSDYIFLKHDVQVSSCLTISSVSIKILKKKFYKDNIPLINKRSIYEDIKSSYFGGVTEVYKPYGENLYYYDVNSLYPYAALNSMPGVECVFENNINM